MLLTIDFVGSTHNGGFRSIIHGEQYWSMKDWKEDRKEMKELKEQ